MLIDTSLLEGEYLIFYLNIEYWPDPQGGMKEAYCVLKIGSKACLIGPVYPTFWLLGFFYRCVDAFFQRNKCISSGFRVFQLKRISRKWYRGIRRHGLIMGCSVAGGKPNSGDSPLQLGPKRKRCTEACQSISVIS